jgi:hypothetical protein
MISRIFYSWQSDLPNATNRGFIEHALVQAAQSIRNDDTIRVEAQVDRDTMGVPGAPDIGATILSKIDKAQVFVCDVSIINFGGSSRTTPNPNVLLELGYAIKALGWDRIMMVMNGAFGSPELLPFDLRTKRVISYQMLEETHERAPERRRLAAVLEEGLRTIFSQLDRPLPGEVIQPLSIADQAIEAISKSHANQTSLVRRFMAWVMAQIQSMAPDLTGEGDKDDLLIEAIKQTQQLVIEFARLAQTVAELNAKEAARIVYGEFGGILGKYHPPRGFSGSFGRGDFDFYRFLGHELFVILMSFLIRDNRRELLAELLDQKIYVENTSGGSPGLELYTHLSDAVLWLQQRKQRLVSNQISFHADILNVRHTVGPLAELVPMRQFMDADYMLFLREGLHWRPWSVIYMGGLPPRYLVEAQRASYAQLLLRPFKTRDIESLQTQVAERAPSLRQLFPHTWGSYPLEDYDFRNIGTDTSGTGSTIS